MIPHYSSHKVNVSGKSKLANMCNTKCNYVKLCLYLQADRSNLSSSNNFYLLTPFLYFRFEGSNHTNELCYTDNGGGDIYRVSFNGSMGQIRYKYVF